MSILVELECTKQSLYSIQSGGLDLSDCIKAVEDAIDLIATIHELVDGKECGADFTSDVIDELVSSGLEVRSPDDMEDE